MVLKSERLTIRYITQNDWKAVKEIWNNQKQSQYAQYDRANSTEDGAVRHRVSMWEESNRGTECRFFAVCLQDTMIGYIVFRSNGNEIGYCFHSDYHKKGYAKESLSVLLNYLYSQGITKYTAGTALNNIPSVRLLTSLGFEKTGEEKVSFYKDSDGNDIVFTGGIFTLDKNER